MAQEQPPIARVDTQAMAEAQAPSLTNGDFMGWFEKKLGTDLVETKVRRRATALKSLLFLAIFGYLCFDLYNIFFQPKVLISGTLGSDQWGFMPNLLVCHDRQYQVQWRAADMFVRHFDGTSFDVTEHHDFEVSVTNPTSEPPGQGGSCLKISTSLVPFPRNHAVGSDQEDPIAWYVFDFLVSSPEIEENVVGVPDTLYLIAEDNETGHQSFIGTTPHLYPETHNTVASTMIELSKMKRIKDGDFEWTGLTRPKNYFTFYGRQHTVRLSHVNRPVPPVNCATTESGNLTMANGNNSTDYCTTNEADSTMAVVELVMSNHDVETLHKLGQWRRAMMACASAGGFLSVVALVYNQVVVKKFAPSYHEVFTTIGKTKKPLMKLGDHASANDALLQKLLDDGDKAKTNLQA